MFWRIDAELFSCKLRFLGSNVPRLLLSTCISSRAWRSTLIPMISILAFKQLLVLLQISQINPVLVMGLQLLHHRLPGIQNSDFPVPNALIGLPFWDSFWPPCHKRLSKRQHRPWGDSQWLKFHCPLRSRTILANRSDAKRAMRPSG